jgi:hypothetical protein
MILRLSEIISGPSETTLRLRDAMSGPSEMISGRDEMTLRRREIILRPSKTILRRRKMIFIRVYPDLPCVLTSATRVE